MLTDAQFAFIGTVGSVDEQVHPWTTDPENPARSDVAEPTDWVTFEVDGWYTRDWGTTFTVWMPTIKVERGDRLAVAGDAYHTEVAGFSGQSGEVEFCTALSGDGATPGSWDRFFGGAVPPSAVVTSIEAAPPSREGSKVFGEHTEQCAATVLTNDVDDDAVLAAGVACFVEAFEAGQPAIWDVVVATVEGDPVPSRYDYDGETVTITTDYSFDNFGSGGVIELRCTGIRPTGGVPEGADCTSSDGDGFRPDSLPFGT